MSKKNWLLVLFLFALMAVYAIYFTDWFKTPTVRISHVVREVHFRRRKADDLPTLIFGLNKQIRLTEIKVVPLAEFEKNPAVLPIWHLVSDSNSVPLREFLYGKNIPGMKPAVPGTTADAPETNIVYRLFLTAGRIKGVHDFHLGDDSSSTNPAGNP